MSQKLVTSKVDMHILTNYQVISVSSK